MTERRGAATVAAAAFIAGHVAVEADDASDVVGGAFTADAVEPDAFKAQPYPAARTECFLVLSVVAWLTLEADLESAISSRIARTTAPMPAAPDTPVAIEKFVRHDSSIGTSAFFVGP